MNQTTVSLRSCIEKIMSCRELNISKLKLLMDYSSETTLRRVMRDEAKLNALRKVKNDLMCCNSLNLSAIEKDMLNSAIWFHEKGDEYYTVHRELWSLLRRQQVPEELPTFIGKANNSPYAQSLSPTATIECLIINSCFDSALCYVKKLIQRHPSISIRHFISYPSKPYMVVRTIRKILPLIGMCNYSAFTGVENEQQIPGYNVIVVRAENRESEVIFLDEKHCAETVYNGAFEKWNLVAEQFQSRELTSRIPVEDIAPLLEKCYRREKGKESIEIRPDLCMRYIASNVVKASFKDQCRLHGIHLPKEYEAALLNLHNLRYSNIFESEKTNRLILSKQSMEKFLKTGKTCDHARIMRPYNVVERIQILTGLLNQVEDNPHFYINFLLDQDESLMNSESPVGMACFGDDSMQIDSLSMYEGPETAKSDGGETYYEPFNYEIEIKDRNFVTIFKDFYLNDIVLNHTYPEEETIKFFSYWIKRLSSEL